MITPVSSTLIVGAAGFCALSLTLAFIQSLRARERLNINKKEIQTVKPIPLTPSEEPLYITSIARAKLVIAKSRRQRSPDNLEESDQELKTL